MFDGTRPSEYRRWRRRAELYLMGLPMNVPGRKWGARLLEHLSGEAAEELLEQLPIEKIAKDKGYEKIFDLLDEKYKGLGKDGLQRVMKGYFYSSVIKPNETYSKCCWTPRLRPWCLTAQKEVVLGDCHGSESCLSTWTVHGHQDQGKRALGFRV